MAEFLSDPSVLTKDKLKSALVANNVALPNGDQRKGVYVELYLRNLTSRNKSSGSAEAFSSDEEPPASITARTGRKATRKTDRVRPEEIEVSELTDDELKERLLKYGVNAGPIVASTRKVYEKKLQKFLDQGPPQTTIIISTSESLQTTNNSRNGNSDSDQYSDKEEETAAVSEPDLELELEPVPVVERPLRSRGKTPVTTRTRSSQHKLSESAAVLCNASAEEVPLSLLDTALLQVAPGDAPSSRPARVLPGDLIHVTRRRSPHRCPGEDSLGSVSLMDSPQSPIRDPPVANSSAHIKERSDASSAALQSRMDGFFSPVSPVPVRGRDHSPGEHTQGGPIEKLSAVEQNPKTSERDLLKELFPHEVFNTPTGISATRRQPIKGAAGRPFSDSWHESLRPRLTEHRYTTSSYTESRSAPRVSSAPRISVAAPPSTHLSAPKPAVPPSVQTKSRRRVPMWVQLLLLAAVAGFLLFIYQAMESNQTSPFGRPDPRDGLETAAK